MKKCPKCKAEIADNARFCLYCMTSFEDKENLETQKENNKPWLYIVIAAVLVLLMIIGSVFMIFEKNDDGNDKKNASSASEMLSKPDSDSALASGDTEENSTAESTDITESDEKPHTESQSSADGSSKPDGSTSSDKTTTSGATSSGATSSNKNTSGKNQSSSTNSGNKTPSTTSSNKTPSTSSNDKSSSTDSSVSSSTPAQTTPATVTYTYIDATIDNAYPPNQGMYPPENAIVITGVRNAAADGVYVIPEKIDGKKVAAIMPSAFCDPKISSTVKSVTLPATVRTIWENAFSECYNLTNIYMKSTVIELYENALPPLSKRKNTITLHCSSSCRNFNFYYYRNIAGDFGAKYKEWNG